VAIDGSKIKANASKHKAMSYKRMTETEARLEQEIKELLRQAEETDAAEDAQYGKKRRGDELPEELSRRASRLQKIREAKQALENEAREKAERERAETENKLAERAAQEQRTGKKKHGRKPEPPDPDKATPADKAQRNFTDPESRIMPDGANKGTLWAISNDRPYRDLTVTRSMPICRFLVTLGTHEMQSTSFVTPRSPFLHFSPLLPATPDEAKCVCRC
jgi:hypothetical protein